MDLTDERAKKAANLKDHKKQPSNKEREKILGNDESLSTLERWKSAQSGDAQRKNARKQL